MTKERFLGFVGCGNAEIMLELGMENNKLIIYDGDCGFCTTSVRKLRGMLGKKAPSAATFQSLQLDLFGLSIAEVQIELKYVDTNGQIWGGASAFRRVFYDAKGIWRLISTFMSLPLVKQSSVVIYRKIAKNRAKMPGATATCALPEVKN